MSDLSKGFVDYCCSKNIIVNKPMRELWELKQSEINEMKQVIKRLVINSIEDNRTLRDLSFDEEDLESNEDYLVWLEKVKGKYAR